MLQASGVTVMPEKYSGPHIGNRESKGQGQSNGTDLY